MRPRNKSITLVLLLLLVLIGTGWVLNNDRVQAVGEQQYDLKLLRQVVERIRAVSYTHLTLPTSDLV